MNPELPNDPREELELNVSALLLGELNDTEAAAVREAIANDAELQKLHDDLKQTIHLVREATVSASEPDSGPAGPLKLSDARRKSLLTAFAIPPLKPEHVKPKRRVEITLLELLVVIAMIGLLAALLLPSLGKAKHKAQSVAVLNNIETRSRLLNESAPARPYYQEDNLAGAAPGETGFTWSSAVGSPTAGFAFKSSQPATPPMAPKAKIVLPSRSEVESASGEGIPGQVVVTTGSAMPADSKSNFESMHADFSSAGQGIFRGTSTATESFAEEETPLPAADPETRSIQLHHASAGDVAAALESRDLDRDKVQVDAINNLLSLSVSDREGSELIAKLDTPSRQQLLEKKIQDADPALATPKPDVAFGTDFYENSPRVSGGRGGFAGGGGMGGGTVYASGVANRSLDAIPALEVAKSAETNGRQWFDDASEESRRSQTSAGAFDWALGEQLPTPPRDDLSNLGRLYRLTEPSPSTQPVSGMKREVYASGSTVLPDSGANLYADATVAKGGALGLDGPQSTNSWGLTAKEPGSTIVLPPAGEAQRTIRSDDVANRPDNAKRFDVARTEEATQPYWARKRELAELRTKLDISDSQAASVAPKPELDIPLPRKPATNAPIPQPEMLTRENNFSTFSLNVSDVSFKLAAASLEQGQLPEAASIRSEEFINAFDYRDPEPSVPLAGVDRGGSTPIAFAWERARYPFAHNRDLLRFSVKTAAAGRHAGRPMNIVLLLDNSGSMERADRVQIIREALRVLASQLQPRDKLSVITFARTPRLVADGIPGDQASRVTGEVSGLTPQGGTNLEEAMNLAYQTALRHYLAHGINRVVVMTDGAANLGNVDPESLKQQVESNRQQGIALDCFGIGWEGYNDDLLEVLSRNGDGRYGFLNTPEEAATDFAGQLAGALKVAASDVKVQVEFNPARVTAYRQIGYAKHQLTKEQFRDNTVDAAEIAAQEAGNALYTVEVNASGTGPLCIVRVRYKVPGTTDYREQAWDVPYTGTAVSLDQASPAMRLAATACAFSEWLVVSPHAGEVTPDELLRYLGGVPEAFGADPRPRKLEWMIRQARSIAGQ